MSEPEMKETTNVEPRKGISMPVLIAIIAGSIILLFVAILIVFSVMMNNMKESIMSNVGITDSVKVEEEEVKESESLGNYEYMETGRITTNPSGGQQFVVVNLGLFYKLDIKNKDNDDSKGSDPELKSQRLNALIKHKINTQIGDMDILSLQAPRDSLTAIFKDKLTSAFELEGYYLKDVILVEFIIQN